MSLCYDRIHKYQKCDGCLKTRRCILGSFTVLGDLGYCPACAIKKLTNEMRDMQSLLTIITKESEDG